MKKPELLTTPYKAVIYVRVSSKEQEREGFSIPSQLKLLRDHAEKKGLTVVQEYVDVETAKRSGRTQFSEMVKFLKAEGRKKKEAGCRSLLVEKTDRLYRNFKDYVILDELSLDIHLVKENDILSPDSRSHQKLLHGIKVVMAKNYIDNLSEEIGKGMKEKAEQGIFPSRAPMGYLNVICGDKKFIQPDPKTGPLVKKLFAWYATGNHSLLEVTRMIHHEGLLSRITSDKIPRGTIGKILNNPVYYGDFAWNGKLYKGKHEPIVTREIFDQVQDVMNKKNKTRTGFRRHDWTYQGLVSCGHCGCAMVGDIKKGKYVYYHCTGYKGKCPEKYVREEVLARHFDAAIEGLQIDKDILALIIQALKESHQDESQFHEEAVTHLRKEHDVLEKRLEALYLDKLDHIITPEFFSMKAKDWQDKLMDIKARMERHGSAHVSYLNEGIQLLEISQQVLERYKECERDQKRRILNLILSNSIWMNAGLIPQYREILAPLAVMKREGGSKIAPSKSGEGDSEKWWTQGDIVRTFFFEPVPNMAQIEPYLALLGQSLL